MNNLKSIKLTVGIINIGSFTQVVTSAPDHKQGWKLAKKAATNMVDIINRIRPLSKPEAKWLLDEIKLAVSDGVEFEGTKLGVSLWAEIEAD